MHPDYHVEVDHHYYSVPYTVRAEEVEVRFSEKTVEILLKGKADCGTYSKLYSGQAHDPEGASTRETSGSQMDFVVYGGQGPGGWAGYG